MPDNRMPPSFWDRVKEAPLWVKIVVPVVLLIAVIAAIPTSKEENSGDETTAAADVSTAQVRKCTTRGVSDNQEITCVAGLWADATAQGDTADRCALEDTAGACGTYVGVGEPSPVEKTFLNATVVKIDKSSGQLAFVTFSNGCKIEVSGGRDSWLVSNYGGPKLYGGCKHGVKFQPAKPAPASSVPAAPAAPAAAPGPTDEDIRNALDDADPTEFGAVADSVNVKQIERFGRSSLTITLETPEGGFQGASVADLDGSAAAAFKQLYTDTDWQGAATIRFTGGLVDSRTGRDLPNAMTGLYRVKASEARQIDWDNAENVDWSYYRVFTHPALKG